MAGTEGNEVLASLLREHGVRVRGTDDSGAPRFVAHLPVNSGDPLEIELDAPGTLGFLSAETVGLAVLDKDGFCRSSWGLAERLPSFDPLKSAFDSPIASLLEAAGRGVSSSLLHQSTRYFVSPRTGPAGRETIVLVVQAAEEEAAHRKSVRSEREADALRRFGRLLSMNQTLQPLCVAAVHELSAAAKLAAALLWTIDADRKALTMVASTGTNRVGISTLGTLALHGSPTCIAEVVGMSAQPYYLDDVRSHVLTQDLEARFCYLSPGAVSIHPLYIAGNVIGVLELIGREGDDDFSEYHELFQTLAEHLALAVNSAMLFESVEKMANDDALTGIANHRTLQQFLHSRLAESRRTNGEIGLMMIDVDHFRSFNEEEGHDVGDMVLQHVAQILRESVRPYDLAARYGGEEFTVVLPGSGIDSTLVTAERIRRHVEALPITTRSGRVRHITVSIGCASFPSQAGEASILIQAADSALFQAKREGRNRVVLYSGGASQKRSEDLSLELVWNWVPRRSHSRVQAKLDRLEPVFLELGRQLGLSENQMNLLRGLAIIECTYRRLKNQGRLHDLQAIRNADGFRVLLPSLNAIDERFDGKGEGGMAGNRIPVLARVLAAALAFQSRGERAFTADPERFDPEIVRMILGQQAAA
ncbi:MAG TPA: sensor domain-containing diguanylate cyclase [Fimbriimonadaceae bacterium]|nr:sensor domain-containing diguanylate cyclase [Fimbriimonadaceae bacterium]